MSTETQSNIELRYCTFIANQVSFVLCSPLAALRARRSFTYSPRSALRRCVRRSRYMHADATCESTCQRASQWLSPHFSPSTAGL